MKLWLVEIDDADWDYDRFQSAAVWANSAEQAEELVRTELRIKPGQHEWAPDGEPWIENAEWRLRVTPAATEGVVLVHWHAG